MNKPVSEKQQALINRLRAEKDLSGTTYENWTPDWSRATSKAASSVIDYLLTLPRKTVQERAVEVEAGIYWIHGDHLVRVYLGQKSGTLLVKRINFEQDGDYSTVSYEYLGTARRVMTSAATPERLSLEEVGSLGKTFDHCLICGRRLDDPESVDRGIGPVCASRY